MRSVKLMAGVIGAALLLTQSARAQDWQQKWSGGWLSGTCYRLPPPRYPNIGAEAAWMIQHDAEQAFVSKQQLELQALFLRCMRAAGAQE